MFEIKACPALKREHAKSENLLVVNEQFSDEHNADIRYYGQTLSINLCVVYVLYEMKLKPKAFSSKILLFGEYSIIHGSKALSIPWDRFSGYLTYPDPGTYTQYDIESSRQNLLVFLNYLKNIDNPLFSEASFDLARMESDINQGIYFHSNIPQGYGAGSSGALVAALYFEYAAERAQVFDEISLVRLKTLFSIMESFFHGESSGLDPLNCYIGSPLLVGTGGKIEVISLPQSSRKDRITIFLIDSGQPGETAPLVRYFKESVKDPNFNRIIVSELVPLNDSCIEHFLAGKADVFFSDLHKLSQLQFRSLKRMVPEKFATLWNEATGNGEFLLKLCGSGGGGFILGFTRDYNKVEKDLLNEGINTLHLF